MGGKAKHEPLKHSTECSHISDVTSCLAIAGQLTMMLSNSVLESYFVKEGALSTVLD